MYLKGSESFFKGVTLSDEETAFFSSLSKPPFLSLNVLSVYQINCILSVYQFIQSVQFMSKIKNKNTPHVLPKLYGVPCNAYPTNFSLMNFSLPRTSLKTSRFAISVRGPILWNNCLSKYVKRINKFLLFQKRAKENIMEISTAANFFQSKDPQLLN